MSLRFFQAGGMDRHINRLFQKTNLSVVVQGYSECCGYQERGIVQLEELLLGDNS